MNTNQSYRPITTISPQDLHHLLLSEVEHALIDVRETDPFSQRHLLFATPLPFGRLELLVSDLLPRPSLPIVVCDDGEGLARKAADRLIALGYSHISILAGGVSGWAAAGFETYSGVNVPSKAFGEFIEHEELTPSLSADEVHAMMENDADIIILDSRPFEEFRWASIPTGLCCSGAELVYRAFTAVPSPDTTVIVNCAGRTRSIIGAQSLINAGFPNDVYALRNGIMGWRLAGYQPVSGATTWAPVPDNDGITRSRLAAQSVATRFHVQEITADELASWRAERALRSLYVLDVRTIDEFKAGHFHDAIHAPGGQVIQATDQYIGARNARILIVDNDGVRASMTASWLIQMGQREVRTLQMDADATARVTGDRPAPVCGLAESITKELSVADSVLKQNEGALVLDVSLSSSYRAGHIQGAWFVLRSQLALSLAALPQATAYILTSEDGNLAKLCSPELENLTDKPVYCLKGGNANWVRAGQKLVKADGKYSAEPIDIWRVPFIAIESKGETVEDAMRTYLDWEVDLMAQLERDGAMTFQHYPKQSEA